MTLDLRTYPYSLTTMSTETLTRHAGAFIAGAEHANGGDPLPVTNPADGRVFAEVAAGTEGDIDRAVAAARGAFPAWSRLAVSKRGEILAAAARHVEEHLDELVPLLTREQGKTLRDSRIEIPKACDTLLHYAGLSKALRGVHTPMLDEGVDGYVLRRPLGVVGAIVPWNFPTTLLANKLGPALVAGNTVVAKPAGTTPLTTLRFAELLHEGGLPDGVLNVVTGSGATAGNALVAHPDVRKIAFTGSTPVGEQIAALAARGTKRVTLELGGSDPMIICDDADLAAAASAASMGRFYNCGQACLAIKRVYVFASVADEVIEGITAKAAALRIGPGDRQGSQLGPALLTGNTVVAKPADTTPFTTLALAEILTEAGLPPGVLNVVTGTGPVAGEALVRHPLVRKIAFTGSTPTGERIMALAASGVKRVTLELGGSDPMIICDDADLTAAASAASMGRFYNCGQACLAIKRVYVFDSVADEVIAAIAEKAGKLRIGIGTQEGVHIGPLHTERQRALLEDQVTRTLARGGEVVAGGGRPTDPELAGGWFHEPTVVVDPPHDSPMATQEVFGPVLPIWRVRDLDEALALANASPFGLGSSIWTRDLDRAERAAAELECGYTWVNSPTKVYDELPFGGVKSSGYGKEHGSEALDHYSDLKSVVVKRAEV